jgi:hypothetical protein
MARSGQAQTSPVRAPQAAGGEAEFAQEVGQVPVDGVLTQEKALGDLGVAQSLRGELQHLQLARRQHRRCLICYGSVWFARQRTRAGRLAPLLHPWQSLVSEAEADRDDRHGAGELDDDPVGSGGMAVDGGSRDYLGLVVDGSSGPQSEGVLGEAEEVPEGRVEEDGNDVEGEYRGDGVAHVGLVCFYDRVGSCDS